MNETFEDWWSEYHAWRTDTAKPLARDAWAAATERAAKIAETFGGKPPSEQGRRAALAKAIREGQG